MNQRNNDFNSFVLGLIVGGILGTLYAPQKGEETRKVIKKLIEQWSEKGEDLSEEVKEVFDGWKEKAEPMVEEKITPVVEAIKEGAIGHIAPIVEKIEPMPQELESMGHAQEQPKAIEETAEKSEMIQDTPAPPPQPRVEFRRIEHRPKFFRGV